MICYYRYFHSKGPILWKNSSNDIELNNKSVIQNSNTKNGNDKFKYIRSFKSLAKHNNDNQQ